MAKILTSETVDGVTETVEYDETENVVGIRQTQDVQPIIDHVKQANAGGLKEVPGLGWALCEMPVTIALAFCRHKGIDYGRFISSPEHDHEWLEVCKMYSRLKYDAPTKLHMVSK